MERIESVGQCKALIAETKRKFSKADSNFIVMANSLAPVIEEGRLGYQLFDEGLCLYMDEGTYYELYYFWDPAAPLADLRQKKPVVLSEFSSHGRRDAYIAYFGKKAAAAGFREWKRNLQIELALQEHREQIETLYARSLERMNAEGLRLTNCETEQQAEQVLALWREGLPVTDVSLEHAQFFIRKNANVFCVLNGMGEVVGAYWWADRKRGVSEARHVVTRPDYYRKGIGTALVMYCMYQLLTNEFITWLGWVADDNVKSLAMHKNIGCIINGNTSTQFILDT